MSELLELGKDWRKIDPSVRLFMLSSGGFAAAPFKYLGYSLHRLERISAQFAAAMGDAAFLVTSILPLAAPKHGWFWGACLNPLLVQTMIFNALEMPAAVVPII